MQQHCRFIIYYKVFTFNNHLLKNYSIARLKLFSYLRKVERTPGCEILYVDTDSVLFKHPKGLVVIKEGQYLGEMTREYADFNIIEFIAGGPKYNYFFTNYITYFRQYALKLSHKTTGEEKFLIKLRGITLNHDNSQRIQYESFKEMILKFGEEEKIIECSYFKLGPEQNSTIMSKNLKKKYKVVNRKGLVASNYRLYPFGFK